MPPPVTITDMAVSIPREDAYIQSKDAAITTIVEKSALAATKEIDINTSPILNSNTTGRYLVTSPYTEQEHLLDLERLNQEDQILALALTQMKAIREDYSTASYLGSFNWIEVMERVRKLIADRGCNFKEKSWYIVAFRSQIKSASDYPDLGALDKAAHAEAMASGGFLKYWFGLPNQDLRNLATCIWCSYEDAKKGSMGPDHRRAAMSARHHYSEWKIDQHRLVIRDGAASWEIVKW